MLCVYIFYTCPLFNQCYKIYGRVPITLYGFLFNNEIKTHTLIILQLSKRTRVNNNLFYVIYYDKNRWVRSHNNISNIIGNAIVPAESFTMIKTTGLDFQEQPPWGLRSTDHDRPSTLNNILIWLMRIVIEVSIYVYIVRVPIIRNNNNNNIRFEIKYTIIVLENKRLANDRYSNSIFPTRVQINYNNNNWKIVWTTVGVCSTRMCILLCCTHFDCTPYRTGIFIERTYMYIIICVFVILYELRARII